MAMLYVVRGETADGTYDTGYMSRDHREMFLSSITFYDAGGAVVTPSAGTVNVTLSPDGKTSFLTIKNGAFNAADAYLPTRGMPNALGQAEYGRITLAGVTGAARFEAVITRY